MPVRFFASKTVRTAMDTSKQVRKLLAAQRDILAPAAVTALESAIAEVEAGIATNVTENELTDRTTKLEDAANKWLKRYPNPGIRENVEVLLVALAVAMAIRTFFVQPFKIPTGSMQPTLFGVTPQQRKGKALNPPPSTWQRIYEGCIQGTFYHYLVAEDDGQLIAVGPPKKAFKFINQNSVTIRYRSGGEKTYTFWMTPDIERMDPFLNYAGLEPGQIFRKGEEIVNFKEIAGDHLFVDRVSYNFRKPTRGEIIVFETRDIGNEYAHLPPDQFYIKRMVAMGNEKVSIGDDRHLVIDGKRLDKDTPHFEKVYSFDPSKPPRSHDSVNDLTYSGHLNQTQADKIEIFRLSPLFPDQNAVYQIPPDHYMVMGDNTANSFDSRAWGDFSRTNVIGKYFFVYWPFNQRFGWSVR